METLMLPFSPRFIVLTICAVVTALLLGLGIVDHKAFDLILIPLVVFGALTLLGIRDLTQKSHAVLRNYPISAHLRFLLEEIRPEMRQYFFESEKDYAFCAACSVPEIGKLAETISAWQEPMILAIETGLSNARSEGYNRIVKHVGRIAFGFRTPENQRRRVRWAWTRQSRRAPSSSRHLRPC